MRTFNTPSRRSRLTQELQRHGSWTGSIEGQYAELYITSAPRKVGWLVKYRFAPRKFTTFEGVSDTVFDALETMQARIERYSVEVRSAEPKTNS